VSTAAEYIGLTPAVTWIAFGVEHNAREFLQELAGDAPYGVSREAAYDKFLVHLTALLKSVFDGEIPLRGRYLISSGSGQPKAPQTIKIDPLMLADFCVLDFGFDANGTDRIPRLSENSFDILRRGKPHLLWVPRTNDGGYVLPNVLLDDYIECVSIARGDLRKHFKAGVSPRRSTQTLPNLPEAKLNLWWGRLSPEEQEMPRRWLEERLKTDFPDHGVSRSMLRAITGLRKAGRPKKSARD
jgi:hypothetical protein